MVGRTAACTGAATRLTSTRAVCPRRPHLGWGASLFLRECCATTPIRSSPLESVVHSFVARWWAWERARGGSKDGKSLDPESFLWVGSPLQDWRMREVFFWLMYGKQVCRAKREVEKENGGGQAGRTCPPVRSCRRKGYGNQESGHKSSKEAMLARPDKDGFPLDRTDAAASFQAQVGMDKGSGQRAAGSEQQAVGSWRARARTRARRALGGELGS